MDLKEYNYGDGYFPKLFIEKNKIVDARCKCKWGETNKNAWKEGKTICKHLQAAIREFNLEIKNKKKVKKIIGLKSCHEWLKDAYRKAVEFTCEDCNKHEDEIGKLEPHRIICGYNGGTYRPGNVKMLCNKCHKMYGEKW